MVKLKRIIRLSRIAVILVLVVALCLACVSPGYAVIAEASIIVPVVIAALAAFGIGTGVHAMQSGNVISWYSQKLEQWASSLGSTVNSLLDVAKITTDPLGVLRLAPSFLLKVKQFAQWLQSDMGISSGGSPVVSKVGDFASQPIGVYISSDNDQTVYSKGSKVATYLTYEYRFASTASNCYSFAVVSGNTKYLYVVNFNGNFSLKYVMYNGSAYTLLSSSNSSYSSTYNAYLGNYSNTTNYTLYVPVFDSVQAGVTAAREWVQNPTSITLTPGAIAYPETTGDDDEDFPYVIDYGGVAGDTVEDAADTIMEQVISNDLVVDGAIETPPEAIEWADIVSPRAVNGLDDIFPFCIPFDVYHFFQAMIATPTAPHFEVPFVVPGLVNYTFVLDFAQFNTVAQIFRTMELLCFCIGLALATRRLIRG